MPVFFRRDSVTASGKLSISSGWRNGPLSKVMGALQLASCGLASPWSPGECPAENQDALQKPNVQETLWFRVCHTVDLLSNLLPVI